MNAVLSPTLPDESPQFSRDILVQFTFTDEQDQLRDTLKRFLNDHSSSSEVRQLMETELGYNKQTWRSLCHDLGMGGIHVPETYGGVGLSYIELGIALEEMGKELLCSPFLSSSVFACNAIMLCGTSEQQTELLPPLTQGIASATVAFTEYDGRWDAQAVQTTFDKGVINGSKHFVIDGSSADQIITIARTKTGLGFFLVDRTSDGLTCSISETLDQTRKQSTVDFKNCPAIQLGSGDQTQNYSNFLDLAAVALSNEMVGGAQQMLESAVEYAKFRMQFGRAVGSFQAIKHICSDLLLEVEMAKSAAYAAAQAVATNDPELPVISSLAKAAASEAFLHAARDCIQIHGGIGFTWDNDSHLWFKRAKSSEVLLGDPSYHRELMLSRMEV